MDKFVKASPSVVRADEESEIRITNKTGTFSFHDDVTYKVQFVPMDEQDVKMPETLICGVIDDNRKTFYVKPKNGEIHLKYFFKGEQEWQIRISCDEYDKYVTPIAKDWGWSFLYDIPKRGIRVSVYSLKEDLYDRRPVRCDLHLHTNASDGDCAPEVFAAYYRRKGYDTIAITEHNIYNTARFANEKLDLKTSFEVLCAEEIHNGCRGLFHMVNIGSKYSINEVYLNEPERVKAEVEELKKTIDIPKGLDENEYANRVWLYNAIKKAGGFAIYPHPFWKVFDAYHTQISMSRAIFENKLCDAFEIIGGEGNVEGTNMNAMLFHEMRLNGVDMPVVGSTDCHSPFNPKAFGYASTIVFADSDIIDAIKEKYSVAVEHENKDTSRVYGDFRLVKYTHFLLRNYYPIHNDICFAQGDMMVDYVLGNKELKKMIEEQEIRLDKFNKLFFGGEQ